MIPVLQRDITPHNGECFRACIASIFEMKIDAVPHFCSNRNEGWFDDLSEWVMLRNMAVLLCLTHNADSGKEGNHSMPYGYSIMSGLSPTGVLHSVVAWGDRDGYKMVFDPHPDKVGLLTIRDIIVFTLINPVKQTMPLSWSRKQAMAVYEKEPIKC